MSHFVQQPSAGLQPLNPNAFDNNTAAMGLSPITPGTPSGSCVASFSGSGVVQDLSAAVVPTAQPSSNAQHQHQQLNTSSSSGASSSANNMTATTTTTTTTTKSTAGRRRYTHNPYSTATSSRSSVASSENNSAPPTPISTTFAMAGGAPPTSVANNHVTNTSATSSSSTMMSSSSPNSAAAAAMAAAGYQQQQQQQQLSHQAMQHHNYTMQQQMQQQHPHHSAPMEHFMLPPGPASSSSSRSNSMMMMQQQQQQQQQYHAGYHGHHHGHGMPQQHHHHQQQQQQQPMTSSNNTATSASSTAAAAGGDFMMYGGSVHSLKNAVEQFDAMRGTLAQQACSQRGRHVIIGMVRMQQPEYADAIYAELVPAWGMLMQDINGCHVARTFIECLPPARMAELCATLPRETVLAMCAASQHSRRVLQAMFENHSAADVLAPVVENIISGAVALATTQQGCISVMRAMEFSAPPQREQLMGVLAPHLAALAMDPYGNYVVQTITQSLTREEACATLEKSFAGAWVPLSCNKFASNVVEKLIRVSTPSVRTTIVHELCLTSEHLAVIISDGFGNFVLQAIIDSCVSAAEFKRIAERVRPLLTATPYGHKIEGKLKSKRFPGMAPLGSSSSSASSKSCSANNSQPQTPRGE